MKINLEFDDNELIYQLMDGMFVVMLKNALREDKAYYEAGNWLDDIEMYKKNIEAYEHLIKYYSKPGEIDND